jgi:hypothetical protein
MYKVIKHFTDMQDNNHPYNVGDTYPRKGVKVLASRYKELSGSNNRQGCPLIEEIEETKPESENKPENESEDQ